MKNGFTKSSVNKHQKAINDMIEQYAKENNLAVKRGNVVYNTNSIKFNGITLKLEGVESPQDIVNSSILGYANGSLIGKTFTYETEEYKIIELKPRNKMPIIVKDSKGTGYRFPKSIVSKVN